MLIIDWSVILVEETGVPGENHRRSHSHIQTLSHNVVLSTASGVASIEAKTRRFIFFSIPAYSVGMERIKFAL